MHKKAYIKVPDVVKHVPDTNPPTARSAIINGLCPQCRRGKVFKKPFYSPAFYHMNSKCPHCDLRYEIEPGFFWGAMYLNYGFSVLIAAITGIIVTWVMDQPSAWTLLGYIAFFVFALVPVIFRISRMLLLYYLSFIRFNPDEYRRNLHKHN